MAYGPLLFFFGLPLAVWAHLSIARELEKRIGWCKDCTVCRSKEAEDLRLEKERRKEQKW